jgi:hypothetical protein
MKPHHWLMFALVAAVFYYLGIVYPAPAKALGIA